MCISEFDAEAGAKAVHPSPQPDRRISVQRAFTWDGNKLTVTVELDRDGHACGLSATAEREGCPDQSWLAMAGFVASGLLRHQIPATVDAEGRFVGALIDLALDEERQFGPAIALAYAAADRLANWGGVA